MPRIGRASFGTVGREADLSALVSQHDTDIKRMLRRIGEIVDPNLPDHTPGSGGDNTGDGAVRWGTTNTSVTRNGSTTVTMTVGGSDTVSATEIGIMASGDTLDSGALVRIEKAGGVWYITNADCEKIS